MKIKKIASILIMIIAILLIAGIFSASYAATGSMYLTIKQLRASGYGYKALEKNIWKITETNSSGTDLMKNDTIYCLKGGPGFGGAFSGSTSPTVRQYTRYFDMKEPDSITGAYASAIPTPNSTKYNSLVWLLNNVYVAPKSTASSSEREIAAEYRELLLKNAKISGSDITDDDIDVVQQLAVWHFTNTDAYKVDSTFELYINMVAGTNSNYNALSDERGEGALNGSERSSDCQALFEYLVNEAESKGSSYDPSQDIVEKPYKIETTDKTIKTVGSNYMIGPFRIEKIGNTIGTLNVTFENGTQTISNPVLQTENGTEYNSIEDTIGKDFYLVLPTSTNLDTITMSLSGSYFDTSITYWSVENGPSTDQPVVKVERTKEDYSDKTYFTLEKNFDLALRKFITSINNVKPATSREPQISSSTLNALKNGTITTAEKIHPKNALLVQTGDKVIYTIRVYNEGKVDGYVKEITDYLPEGLKFLENSTLNKNNGWTNPSGDGKTIVTSKQAVTLLKAFDGSNLQYTDVQIECEVVATVTNSDKTLKNIAEITAHSDKDGNIIIKDIDSDPNNVNRNNYGTTNQEDDDDFELLVLQGKYFDLALRKFITKVNDVELTNRIPTVDTTPLLEGKTTAKYRHPKNPVSVDAGDIVTYTLRVYNEGEVDGYADEITDYLPQWLEFINDEENAKYGWKVSADGRKVTTTITSKDTEYSASRDVIYANRTSESDKVLIKAFDKDAKKLDYIDVKIRCKVKDTGLATKITNIAEITKASNSEGVEVVDRDSVPDNITLPTDELLPNYKDDEIARGDQYIPGQEDDDDFEKVIIQKFDLSLRKFITAVNNTEITNRVPVFSVDNDGKYVYTHTKVPVEVANKDIVTYTLRVYNEGNVDGFADEVKDDVPQGLEFLPDNAINKEYRWKMYKADGTETTNVSEAKTIRSDYLSKAQQDETKRDNLIKAFDKETMTQPDHRNIKIAFKVTEPNTSDRILINTAEISKDKDKDGKDVDDIDSTPDNDKEGEDDIDIEKVKVKYFDLALEKIVTEYSIKLDGKTTVTKTNHKFGVQPEPIVKVELVNSHAIKASVIKFKYQIKITNEGEIEGYADEVKDYIPEGLKFVAEDNPKWKASSDGKTVTTDQLKDTLLKPGDSAVVEITLQWINGQNNLGLKQNWAEISKDRNDSDSPDIDSTPDNNKRGEDDIDDASVILSVKTGKGEDFAIIAGGMLIILSTGIVLIKKFVI